MFGENLGLDYYQQRHTELMQESERARLVQQIEASRRAAQGAGRQAGLHRRALAAAGDQLVRLGSRLQQAALSAQ
jgi:hypothetical protein